MKLGILLNSDNYPKTLVGLTRGGVARGHVLIIFAMDAGVKLLENQDCISLAELEGVDISYCDHSVQALKVSTEGLSENIVRSSQYSNAVMNHQADSDCFMSKSTSNGRDE